MLDQDKHVQALRCRNTNLPASNDKRSFYRKPREALKLVQKALPDRWWLSLPGHHVASDLLPLSQFLHFPIVSPARAGHLLCWDSLG